MLNTQPINETVTVSDLDELRQKATMAEAILSNPLFDEIMTEIHTNIFRDWVQSRASDKDAREALYQYYRIAQLFVGKFRNRLQAYITAQEAEQRSKMTQPSIV